MKYMILFTPSPYSYYRVTKFSRIEEANRHCQLAVEVPEVYLRLITYEEIDLRKPGIALKTSAADSTYIVLWRDMTDYYLLREFDFYQDALDFAPIENAELEEMQRKGGIGIPGSVQVLAAKTLREMNVSQKPTGRRNDIWNLKLALERGGGAVYGQLPKGWTVKE